MTAILIVEDEESLAQSLAFSLKKSGYDIHTVSEGDKALPAIEEIKPDLILLDVMLPGKDGYEICRDIQKLPNPMPIIMITARSSETDRVVGLELGADDYVIKPFSTRELEARIKVVLRRRKAAPIKKTEKGELQIDFSRRIAKRNEQEIELSPKEWDLLAYLTSQNGKIATKEEILTTVWGNDFLGDPKTLEIHVHWLRQKLESDPKNPKHVITVKRKGYRFEP